MSKQIKVVEFGRFRMDVEECLLLDDGQPVSLEPQVFKTLLALVENNGHLSEKGWLMEQVWGDTIVEEGNLTRNISALRKVLGDGYIQTIPKRGYRFVEPVNHQRNEDVDVVVTQRNDELQVPSARADASVTQPGAKPKRETKGFLFAVGFLTAVVLIVLVSLNFRSKSSFNPNKVKSIAVLPLKPLTAESGDPNYELGITESLILELGSAKNLIVRPLSATRQYTDIAQDAIAAGKEQQVDYVLDWNYQLAGGKIKVTALLFNVSDGHIEETYKSEKNASNDFATQDAVAGELGNILLARCATTSRGPVPKRGTTNEEAYRLYLHGKNLFGEQSAADAKRAIEYFEQSTRLDPNFARAYAGMAHAYIASGAVGGGLPDVEKAKEAVTKALELDDNLAEVYTARADLRLKFEWDLTGAEKDLLRAIELEPKQDLAHWTYALLLAYRGRFDEAMAEIETSLAIVPSSLMYQRDRGRILYYARRYDDAIVQLERVIELDANFSTAYDWLWDAYAMKGDYVGAYNTFMRGHKRVDRREAYQKAYETAGWKGVTRKALEFKKLNEDAPRYGLAVLSALLGEKEQAFNYLNEAVEKREWVLVWLNVEPTWDSLRDDPRFDGLVRRVGLK